MASEAKNAAVQRALEAVRSICRKSSVESECPIRPAPDLDNSDVLDDLRQPFVTWFDSRIQLDAKAVALRLPPRWSTTVTALYGDFCAQMFERQQAPPTSQQFRNLLLEACCELRSIRTEEYVLNVILRDDLAAIKKFETPPPPPPAERRTKTARRQR